MAKSRKPQTGRKKAVRKKALPILSAALFCERVIFETDEVPTIIRIVDTLTLGWLPPEERFEEGVQLQLNIGMFFLMKSGNARGERTLRVVQIDPQGNRSQAGQWTYDFKEPPEGGHQIRVPHMVVQWAGEGLYWYEISIERTALTRVPLRIIFAEPSPRPPSAPAGYGRGI